MGYVANCRSIPLFTRLAFGEAGQPEPNLLGYSQSAPDLRKETTQLQPPPVLRGGEGEKNHNTIPLYSQQRGHNQRTDNTKC